MLSIHEYKEEVVSQTPPLQRDNVEEPRIYDIQENSKSYASTYARTSHRDAGKLVDKVLARIKFYPASEYKEEAQVERGKQVRCIIETLVFPFVARASQRPVWFSGRKFERFVRNFQDLTDFLISLWDIHNKSDRIQKYLKWHNNQILAKCLGSRISVDANLDDVKGLDQQWIVRRNPYKGYLGRFVKRRLVKKDREFCYSLQKGAPKGWPALSQVSEYASLEKHLKLLQRPAIPIDRAISHSIISVSRHVFRRLNRADYEPSSFLVTASGNNSTSRSQGGNMSDMNVLSFVDRSALMFDNPITDINENFEQIRKEVLFHSKCKMDIDKEDSMSSAYRLRAISLAEPGKFRIITVGHGATYTYARPLQSDMLNCWKNHKCSTMLLDDLTERVNELHALRLPSEEYVCSIDYSSATDFLEQEATILALVGLEQNPFYEFARECFRRKQWIYYPRPSYSDDEKEKKEEKVAYAAASPIIVGKENFDQMVENGLARKMKSEKGETEREYLVKNGQLMGHPLSFPLLCVINLACHWATLRKLREDGDITHRQEKEKRNQIIINGDDALFFCSDKQFRIFKDIAGQVGLKVNLAKTYMSRDSAMINSQLFKLKENGVWSKCSYLSMKVVTGVSLKTGESRISPESACTYLNKHIPHCRWLNSCVPAIIRNAERLQKFKRDYTPNWIVPAHLGGYGLNPEFRPEDIVTSSQKDLEVALLRDVKPLSDDVFVHKLVIYKSWATKERLSRQEIDLLGSTLRLPREYKGFKFLRHVSVPTLWDIKHEIPFTCPVTGEGLQHRSYSAKIGDDFHYLLAYERDFVFRMSDIEETRLKFFPGRVPLLAIYYDHKRRLYDTIINDSTVCFAGMAVERAQLEDSDLSIYEWNQYLTVSQNRPIRAEDVREGDEDLAAPNGRQEANPLFSIVTELPCCLQACPDIYGDHEVIDAYYLVSLDMLSPVKFPLPEELRKSKRTKFSLIGIKAIDEIILPNNPEQDQLFEVDPDLQEKGESWEMRMMYWGRWATVRDASTFDVKVEPVRLFKAFDQMISYSRENRRLKKHIDQISKSSEIVEEFMGVIPDIPDFEKVCRSNDGRLLLGHLA